MAVDYIVRHHDYTDVICFAFWVQDNYAINTILNNLDEIKHAAAYVKDTISPPLVTLPEHRIYLPLEMRGISAVNPARKPMLHKYHLKHHSRLTRQQRRVMYWMSKGKTVKEIAAHMGLSPRTIEHHLSALKIKLSATSKSELIEKSQIHMQNNISAKI